jgi:hypothetical protein
MTDRNERHFQEFYTPRRYSNTVVTIGNEANLLQVVLHVMNSFCNFSHLSSPLSTDYELTRRIASGERISFS